MDEAYPSREERLKAVTDKLEAGVTEVFAGDRFADYLRTMSKFHQYSFGNILLIAMQFPGATRVAGLRDWNKNFERKVKKGEKGIQILAPCSFRGAVERQKLDPVTRQPMVDAKGNPIIERKGTGAYRFTVVTVFDVSQTEGKEDPSKCYPLVEWGITEAQALEHCYQRGFHWNGLYEDFFRVSCWCCPLQSLQDLRL